MKKITLITLLAALAFSPLCGETKTYWETIQPYHRMTRVYWNVRQLNEDSVRYKEFIQALNEFKQKSKKLQQKVEENNLGKDLMFDRYAILLERQIKGRGYDRTTARGKGSAMRMTDISASHLFMLISNDFKHIREAGIHNFPTPEILKEWVPVFQYNRMFQYFREVADKVDKHSNNYAWGYLFDQRLQLMLIVSKRVQQILQDKMPELVRHNNIHTETRVLVAYCNVVRKRTNAVDIGGYNVMAKGGKKEESKQRILRSDMHLAMRNIERILNRFKNEVRKRQQIEKREKEKMKRDAKRKQQMKERDQKARERQQQRDQAASEAKARALSAQEKQNLSRMKDDELASFMAHRYNSVFPADNAKSVSADRVEKCMNIMTDSQRQYYESVKARYIRTGSTEKQAELKALKTIRPLLSTQQYRPSRAEMIRTLNK